MRAVVFHEFGGQLGVEEVPDPTPPADGAVIEVRAAGLCRSDWHGWQGHDPDIRTLPHVPGHELAGVVLEVGAAAQRDWLGRRVTMPFVAACGHCPTCRRGAPQVCDRQFQPGFTAWGAFAERVAVRYADRNLVPLPDSISFAAAASLGCRTGTAYRAVTAQGRAAPGEWVAVHGCGGVGLAAIAFACAGGCRVVAVDVREEPLALARVLGAEVALRGDQLADVGAAIRDATGGGADLSLDALGSAATAANSLRSLRKQGRHVQVGLLAGADFQPRLPLELVIARELEILGSHGLAAADYGQLLALVDAGKLPVERWLGATISLAEACVALPQIDAAGRTGVTIVDPSLP